MSDDPPKLRIIEPGGDPDLDIRGLRMWAVETSLMIVPPGPKALDKVRASAERLVHYVLSGDRDER